MIYNASKNNIIYAVEIQEKLANIAKKSVILNNLEGKIIVLHDDIRNLMNNFSHEYFDVVTVNPPYIPAGKGKVSAKEEQLLARHEININIENMFAICGQLLKKRGRIYLIHRADSLVQVIMVLKKYLLEPKILKFIYTSKNQKAKRVLIEARKEGGSELKVLPPLVIK